MTDIPAARLRRLVQDMRGRRLLVLGDMVADEQLVGRPATVAREAPVLVLEEVERTILPGGATNVAANAAALGAAVGVCGVLGDDAMGELLRERLRAAGIDVAGLVVDAARPTTTKTRIWAGGVQQQVQQLLLRMDRFNRQPVDGVVLETLLSRLRAGLRPVSDSRSAVVMSDYEIGVMHRAALAEGITLAREAGAIVVADAHSDLLRFKGATALTPNQPEAEATLGRRITSPAELDRAGADLLAGSESAAVLITRGREGMSLYTHDGPPLHLPAMPVAGGGVADPTGAGDTVAAAFTLALAAGGSFHEAAVLANLAAGAVVAKVGTATVSAGELLTIVAGWPGTTDQQSALT